jgi:hypothetical protein
MFKNLLLSLFLIVLVLLLIHPIVYIKPDPILSANPKLKKNQTFKLNQFINSKNKQLRAYLILGTADMKSLPSSISKYRVLKTIDKELVQDLLNLDLKAATSDISTVTSTLVIYADKQIVFSTAIALKTLNSGFQQNSLGWISPIDEARFIEIFSKFKPHYIPVLILN